MDASLLTEFLVEMVAVICGVLIAFQIDRWSIRRKEARSISTYLLAYSPISTRTCSSWTMPSNSQRDDWSTRVCYGAVSTTIRSHMLIRRAKSGPWPARAIAVYTGHKIQHSAKFRQPVPCRRYLRHYAKI